MPFAQPNIWEGSSWRDSGKKYCKICKEYIRLGSPVRFSYDAQNRGLCHEKCADQEIAREEKEYESICKENQKQAYRDRKDSIPRGDIPSPAYIARKLKRSETTVRLCLNSNYKHGSQKTVAKVIEYAISLGYDKTDTGYSWPGRFVVILRPDGEEEYIDYNRYMALDGFTLEKKIEIPNDNRVIFYIEYDYDKEPNHKASYWSGKKIKGKALVCTIKDWLQIQELGKLKRD